MSSGKDNWATPDYIFEPLNAEFNFDFDVAADVHNRKTSKWFGVKLSDNDDDGLTADWKAYGVKTAWCNPPYSRGLQKQFIAKAADARFDDVTTVMLLPARTDTVAFHTYIYNKPWVEIRFLKGRIKFVGAKHGAPFPSMVVVFRP